MSSSNAELVQRVLGAYLTGDEKTLREMIPPEAEIYAEPGLINAGTYHGFDGFQAVDRSMGGGVGRRQL